MCMIVSGPEGANGDKVIPVCPSLCPSGLPASLEESAFTYLVQPESYHFLVYSLEVPFCSLLLQGLGQW